MASFIRWSDLDRDDEGNLSGVQLGDGSKRHTERIKYLKLSDLLLDWIPREDQGGYVKFIEDYKLQGLVTEAQLKDVVLGNARVGRNLAGVLSVLVPSNLCSWRECRNAYERSCSDYESSVVDLTPEQKNEYLGNVLRLAAENEIGFGSVLMLLRRSSLKTQVELEQQAGLANHAVNKYETQSYSPPIEKLHALCDVLKVSDNTRQFMIEASNKDAHLINDPKRWRKGFAAYTGGTTLFGALLYNLRIDKVLTREALEQEAGLGRNSVQNYETQGIAPPVEKLHALCDALDVRDDIRQFMLEASNKDAHLTNDPKRWRKGFAAYTGAPTLFGALLYSLRTEKNLTREQLSEKAGLTKQAVASYEIRGCFPSIERLYKLFDALGVGDDMGRFMLEAIDAGMEYSASARKLERWR